MPSKLKLRIVKIGGNILDDPARLEAFLAHFAALHGPKILVHGGGKLATHLAEKLGIPQTMVDGRRITDAETLRIAVMVYGGLVNKQIVAQLQALGTSALGLSGADGDLIRAHKRKHTSIDYGWVGDIETVNAALLDRFLGQGLTPVISPLSHDGHGQMLNTNADTMAAELAADLAAFYNVFLFYCFEKRGVLLDPANDSSVIYELDYFQFEDYKTQGIINSGMIPKLENAFMAKKRGVKEVLITNAESIANGRGTRIV